MKEGEEFVDQFNRPDTNKYQCKRCEKWILIQDEVSHNNSHSTQILDWLYLGGSQNAGNLKELTVRTNISYILNVAIELQEQFPNQFQY